MEYMIATTQMEKKEGLLFLNGKILLFIFIELQLSLMKITIGFASNPTLLLDFLRVANNWHPRRVALCLFTDFSLELEMGLRSFFGTSN